MPSDVNNNNSPSHGDRRKSSKPIMEKRRRARINASLTDLKSLLLEVMKKEGARHNKMEKADILEMTVKHLRQLQRSQFAAATMDPSVINKYTAGFNECANEVSRYLGGAEALDVEQRARLLNHLANFMTNSRGNGPVNQTSVPSTTTTAYVRPIQTCSQPPQDGTSSTFTVSTAPKLQAVSPKSENACVTTNQDTGETQMQTQAQTRLLSGVQVIPTKMSNGEAAFIIPSNMLTGGQFGQIPGYVIPVYTGAPTSALHVQSNLQASAIISSPIPLNMQAYGATNQLVRIGLPATSMTNDMPVVPATAPAPSNSRTEAEPSANQQAAPAEQHVGPPDPAKEDVWRPW